jgi:hypothetical protein
MQRTAVWVAAIMLSLALGRPVRAGVEPSQPAPGDQAALAADVVALQALGEPPNCGAALPILRRILANPLFEATAPDQQHGYLIDAADCALRTGATQEALDDAKLATLSPYAEDVAWRIRVIAALVLHKSDEAGDAIEQAAKARPGVLNAIPAQGFVSLVESQIGPSDPVQQRRVLAALDKADYRPSAPGDSPDRLWLTYSGLLADDNDNAHAAAVLSA